MKYKLYNEITNSPLEQILYNRGILDYEKWINASKKDINSPFAFGKEKVEAAVELIRKSVEIKREIWVLVDPDADGFTSAAIILNYLYKLYLHNLSKEQCKEKLHFILQRDKQHGIASVLKIIPKDCLLCPKNSLIILPDSSTNDSEALQLLLNQGYQIIILDHHEADNFLDDNENLVIINNQICDYPNKELSGAGVTWQICRAYDEIMGLNFTEKWAQEFADGLIDLAALGCISDMMLYTSIETKAIIDIGLQNIKNPFFYYMVEKNKFSIDKMGGINYMSIAFYVTPFINAIVRSGTLEEMQLIFQSMLIMYAFDKVESGKRGHKGELVPRVEEAVRIAANVKARQTKLQDSAMELLEQRIQTDGLSKNAIIILCCEPGEIEKNLQGLVANKIQAKYQHPCFVLTKSKGKDDKEYYYRGSLRNYSLSENQDLRQLCLDTGIPEYVQGHQNAAGISIAASKIKEFTEITNKQYKNISQEPVYWVDFIWTEKEINSSTILEIAESKKYWGQGVPEPYICLKDIPIGMNNVQLLSADKNPTLKIHLKCGVDIMKFKSSQEEYELFTKSNTLLTLVGKCNKNEWMGKITPQIIIEDYELREEWVF